MTTLGFFKLHPSVNIPKFGTEQSACFDIEYNNAGKTEYTVYNSRNSESKRVFSSDSLVVLPGERVMVPTGLIFDIPEGYSVRVHPRSGLSLKQGLVLANSEGVVDSDFVDEAYLLITNMSSNKIVIRNGDRIAQGELIKSLDYKIAEIKKKPSPKTDRKGGYGSTGINSANVASANVASANVETLNKDNPEAA